MAETWLPEEPPPPPARKSSGLRTFLLWLILILFFAAVYISLDSTGTKHHAAASRDGGGIPWWIWPVCVGCLLLPTVIFGWLFGESRRYNVLQRPAFEALGDGNHARAAELFGELAHRFRAKPNVSRGALFNRAWALTRAGDAAAAVGVLLGIERWGKLQVDGLRGLIAIELTRAFAIGGDVDKAQRWFDAARSRTRGYADPGREYTDLAQVEGLVLCRARKFAEAIRLYDDATPRLQSRLPVRSMREVWLLRAFAVSQISAPREGGAAEPWIRLLRATPDGSFAWLTAHWPELAAFVEHELGTAPQRVAAARA